MKAFFHSLLLLPCIWLGACRDHPRQSDMPEAKADATVVQQELDAENDVPSPEEIKELEREIEAGRQNINDIEAFVEMERDKLEENPDYDSSFLQQALHEQQEIREAVESGEKSLREFTHKKE